MQRVIFYWVVFYYFLPRSKTGARRKQVRSECVIFYYFQSRSINEAGPGHVKSRCKVNGSFSIIFSPGPKLGQDLGGTFLYCSSCVRGDQNGTSYGLFVFFFQIIKP